jgi:hypothetical protein
VVRRGRWRRGEMGTDRAANVADRTLPVTVVVRDDEDLLAAWVSQARPAQRSGRGVRSEPGWLRFAFYGPTSTSGYQDRVSSRQWQAESAQNLIAGHGAIVTGYFDVGCSRRLPWSERPQAEALLGAIADSDCGFDAVVVGEYERAFYGDQLLHLAALLEGHGVQLWLPETHGPVNHTDPTHQALITLLGTQSRREVLGSRFRTTAAMRNQAREQGRCLGGRPPYGYRLVDAGPHPNTVHGHWGRRLRRLEPDTVTAPTVTWIFGQRLAGRSVAAIARMLNDQDVPCPSIMDQPGTGIGLLMDGRCAMSWRSWPTRATPAGRCGTGNGPTTTCRARPLHPDGPSRRHSTATPGRRSRLRADREHLLKHRIGCKVRVPNIQSWHVLVCGLLYNFRHPTGGFG